LRSTAFSLKLTADFSKKSKPASATGFTAFAAAKAAAISAVVRWGYPATEQENHPNIGLFSLKDEMLISVNSEPKILENFVFIHSYP